MRLQIKTNCGCDATINGVVTMPLHDMRLIWKANLKKYSGRIELLTLDLTNGQGSEIVTAVVNDVMEVELI
jgi:hypothetical protein